MMQESDPFGIGSYMRSRMKELLGADYLSGTAEPFDIPRSAYEPEIGGFGSFHINPDVEWAFPEAVEAVLPLKGPAQIGEKARGHRPIPGIGTEILESSNTRPARPPRRLFRVDVTENEDFYFLRADLAGMSRENVKISVDENQNLVSFNVEPPKDDFFGLYKSPLESQFSIKEVVEGSKVSESAEGSKEPGSKESKSAESKESKEPEQSKESKQPTPSPHKKEICHLIERSTHPMQRTLKMPKAVDMARVEAEMREGLLVVKFAKKRAEVEEQKKHFVEIK